MPIIIEPEGGEGVSGYTFLELQNEVLAFQFAEGKYRPLVKKWLNQAVRRLVIESEIRTQEAVGTYTTVTEAGQLGLPGDFARVIAVFDTETQADLHGVELRDFDNLVTSYGRPTTYTVIGDEINVHPTPDGEYGIALRYWKLPADMVEDEDTPELPAQYHELPIAFAMKKAYLRENDYNAAAVWDAEWQAGIGKLRGEAQSDFADGPRQVGGTWSQAASPSPQIPR